MGETHWDMDGVGLGTGVVVHTYCAVGADCYLSNMPRKCPKCGSTQGIREAIYGIPVEWPVNEEKYFIAGCTANGGKYVCIICDWGKWKDD